MKPNDIPAGNKTPAPPNECGPRRTIRLLLEYDGSDFLGWQIQASGRTVQGELARALQIFLRESPCPIGSGRTDTATHALGQVAHFHTFSNQSPTRIQKALNALLPADIAVLKAEEAAPEFHARYSARGKVYRYRISNTKTALCRNQVWAFYRPLDLDAMRQATTTLLGTHDFGAFCKRDPVPDNFTCRITRCSWQVQGRELIFEIEANRFLRHMVRIIVGTLVEIGSGRRAPEDMASLLASGDRTKAGPTAPARGLCLLRVYYPEDSQTACAL